MDPPGQTIQSQGGSVFLGDISAGRDVIINHFSRILQVTDGLYIQYGASEHRSERIFTRLQVLKNTAEYVNFYVQDLRDLDPELTPQLDGIHREGAVILTDLRHLVASFEYDHDDQDCTATRLPSGLLHEQILDIRNSLIHIQLTLSLLYNRRQAHMNEDFIRKVVIDVIDNKEENDDTSSVHTFYTASSGSLRIGQDLDADIATLPCFSLTTRRDPHFYGREKELAFLDAQLNALGSHDKTRVVTVHGIGGVGKSSLAQEYAFRKQHHVDALLWIYCESQLSVIESFVTVAVRLGLPGVDPNQPIRNCELVLRWLHSTRARWLLIYDNVEDQGLVSKYWPATSRGQVIITTRHLDIVYLMSDLVLEVEPWDEVTGANYILNFLARAAEQNDLQAEERNSALELSQKLGGLPLAISHMSRSIMLRRMRIRNFVALYEHHGHVLLRRRPFYSVSNSEFPVTVWDSSFSTLDEFSSNLLTVLCFLSAHSVSQTFFEPPTNNESYFPEILRFCHDEFEYVFYPRMLFLASTKQAMSILLRRQCDEHSLILTSFEEALDNLLTCSLVRRNPDTRDLSTHLLVQSEFLRWVGHEQRQRGFECALDLLIKRLSVNGFRAQLRILSKEQYTLCIPHIISIQTHVTRISNYKQSISVIPAYFRAIARVQWYCHENNLFEALDASVKMMGTSWPELSMLQQDPPLKASLTSLAGLYDITTRKNSTGLDLLYQAYGSLEQEHSQKCLELSRIATDLANSSSTLNRFEEALLWHMRARNWWKQWSVMQKPEPKLLPASMAKDVGITQIWAASKDRPYEQFYGVIRQIELAEPYDWILKSEVYFALGTTSYVDNKLEKAEDHFHHALTIWRCKASGKHDPVVAMCNYRLGCIAARRHDLKTAIKFLQDACEMTKSWATYLKAEHARCLFKLSEVMAEDSGNSENKDRATELRASAEKLLLEQDPKAQQPFDGGAYDSRVCIQWR